MDPATLDPDVELVIVNALAMRGFPPPMPGCEIRVCIGCKRDTWAAPSSVAAEKVRHAMHLCKTCALILATEVGGLEVNRLPGAAADVTAPGSLVTPEGEEAVAERLRRGR